MTPKLVFASASVSKSEQDVAFTNKLTKTTYRTDYTVRFASNTNTGTAIVKATGTGNY